MARPIVRHVAAALAAAIVAGWSGDASAGWREDAACVPSRQPSGRDWVEPWAAWWSRCATAADSPAPPLCSDESRQRVVDTDEGCLIFACQGGTFDIRSCADSGAAAMPRISGIRLFANGYAALVEHKHGSKEDTLAPDEIPLAYALRALIAGAKLPDKELKRVPLGFWQRQRSIVVDVQPGNDGLVVNARMGAARLRR